MGYIHSGEILIIQNIEKIKQNELEQNRVISNYVYSSQIRDSESSSNYSSLKNSFHSEAENSDYQKESKNDIKN